jgi:hypothetical protein
LLRAVSAEAGKCSRPRRYGGSPALTRLTLAPPPPPPEAGVARGRRETIPAVASTRRRALLAQGRAAARRPLLGVGGSAEADRLSGQR